MALTILPHLMTTSLAIQDIHKRILILTATSGDTGKAALSGFANVDGIDIIVFYPKDGVSVVQEKQMLTQEGDNTRVVGVVGNFVADLHVAAVKNRTAYIAALFNEALGKHAEHSSC